MASKSSISALLPDMKSRSSFHIYKYQGNLSIFSGSSALPTRVYRSGSRSPSLLVGEFFVDLGDHDLVERSFGSKKSWVTVSWLNLGDWVFRPVIVLKMMANYSVICHWRLSPSESTVNVNLLPFL
jgi:hypothetical protein